MDEVGIDDPATGSLVPGVAPAVADWQPTGVPRGKDGSWAADFNRPPATPEATALAVKLAQRADAWQGHTADPRSRRKKARTDKEQHDLVNAAGRFAGALAVAVDGGNLGLLGCHKSRNWFTNQPVSYRSFMALHATFVALGWIVVEVRGSWAKDPEFGPKAGSGYVERIRPTTAWVDLLRGAGIEEGEARRHFIVRAPPVAVTLREKNRRIRRGKVRGRLLPLPDTAAVERARAEVDELNRFIGGVQVAIPDRVEFSGWTRSFNDGDVAGADLGRGGRLVARPGASYQSLNDAVRGQITLNGLSVVEIDITACHLTLVYAARRLALAEDDHDPYAVEGVPRPVVKRWMTVTLGHGALPMRWPAGTRAKMQRKHGIDLQRYPLKKVTAAVIDRHPVLADLSGVTATVLQYQESEVIVATMLRLNRDHGIPVLPVHDSLIVPREAAWVAASVLGEEFRAAVGQPMLTPKFTPPIEQLPAPHRTRFAHLLREPGRRGVPRGRRADVADDPTAF